MVENRAAALRALCIDDEASVRALLITVLEQAGFVVKEASNGAEGLTLVCDFKPDIVLLDVNMPDMTGFDVCRRIKDDRRSASTRVIMCTSENRKDSLIAALRAGADDYIVKPFKPEAVLTRVQRVLTARPTVTPPPIPIRDLRRAVRRSTRWQASWSTLGIPGFEPAYKCRVLDISIVGMAFDFNRCATCTGYEKGSVHPKCIFAAVARQYPDTPVLTFILSVGKNVVLEVQGKVVHVFQPPDTPTTERVGVQFVGLSTECTTLIEQYVAGTLTL
ncbi:MAG: response regulator [Planctomycetes bacterium]|nr:response regulator [Planctomycetota bacterium]